ncbi:hypothetical protein GDO86_014556 [Hymenochirus boettgeri]|uniref:SH2 domain-containing protein 3A n=1 Tax=Hymenochirus boettgeri TaxID=247094 RepID=A0A8T2JS68_9PIPI|nr:hypothetical protein GDO86_014556 [Hymenochirus boettgeri]
MLSPTDVLKKELEEELKLSSDDLRSHAWYYEPVPPREAEKLLVEDGDFLIRDSVSSPGDYVLSCCCSGHVLHFKIIAVTLRPRRGVSKTLYQLEQDQFDNIPALVRSYVGDRRKVSDSTGAVIIRPVNRTLPLRALQERRLACGLAEKDRRKSLNISDSSLLRNKDRFGSHPGNLDTLKDKPLQSAQSDSNLPLAIANEALILPPNQEPVPLSPLFRTGSDPVLRTKRLAAPKLDPEGNSALRGSDSQLHSKAPPKPIRAPSLLISEPLDGSATYSELVPQVPIVSKKPMDQVFVEQRWKNRVRATETTFGFLESEETQGKGDPVVDPLDICQPVVLPAGGNVVEEDSFVRPQTQTTSSYQPKTFQSLLLLPENKPLEPAALRKLKEIVSQRDCRESALHILQEDCQDIRIYGVTPEQQRIMGVQSGLELLTLPHGQQLRQDLLERHHLLCLGIAVDILGCTGAVSERAHTLHRIIQLAVELKDYAGDLFAFSAVMKALTLPQVSRLEQTWLTLQQTHTDSAIIFQKQLKPTLRDLEECQ